MTDIALPIDSVREPLMEALSDHLQFIVHAPPGAGKSTRLPLWLLSSRHFADKKIFLIQPRRLAATNVAAFLARQLGEKVGQQVGLRTRFDTRVSPVTRLEVMTEGVFVRAIQSDPELAAVSCVIFDEFHERSLAVDLGLALALDCQQGFRDEDTALTLIVMSATLAVEQLKLHLPLAQLLACEGRSFPVMTHYRAVPDKRELLAGISRLIGELLLHPGGSILVFLPGMGDIRRLQGLLQQSLQHDCLICPLHASLPQAEQRLAVSPPMPGERKIILSTNVAETSVTIDGVTVVVDSGLARRPHFDAQRGMSQLKTQMISRASATQREGRAGRTAAGDCYRMWSKDIQATLLDYDRPEILDCDLSALLLELAVWGEPNVAEMTLLDQPSVVAVAQAASLLMQLEAVDERGQATECGQRMSRLGLPPRLAALCLHGESLAQLPLACLLATLLNEADSAKLDSGCDIHALLERFVGSTRASGREAQLIKRLWDLSARLLRRLDSSQAMRLVDLQALPALLLSAFPDHLARQRQADSSRYLMVAGQELLLERAQGLQGSPWLLVLDYHGQRSRAVVRSACALKEVDVAALLQQRKQSLESIRWDSDKGRPVASRQQRLGAIVLSEQPFKPSAEQIEAAILQQLAERGLCCLNLDGVALLQARVAWARQHCDIELPDFCDAALLATIERWLRPYVSGLKDFKSLAKLDIASILRDSIDWQLYQQLKLLAPISFALPVGRSVAIEYGRGERPVISARMQEFYGLQDQPTINSGRYALLVELLSPAGRPLQLTADLPGFWQGSYREVAKEMRGRYPRHYWPDDPATATATSKTKKKM